MTQEHLWSVPVRADDVAEQGKHVICAADEATRQAIAHAAGVAALPRLDAKFHVRPLGAGGLHVTGIVSGTVQQTCVVTLEPLTTEVEEAVDVVFAASTPERHDEIDADATDTQDPPDPLVDGTVDLGTIAVEFLLLGIAPYPRKPGVEFAAPPDDAEKAGPFAALAALKKRQSEEH